MNLDFKDIIILVQFLVIIAGLFGLYKSVPPEFVRIVLGFLEAKAAETPDKTDDAVVAEAKKLLEQLMNKPVTASGSGTPGTGIPSVPGTPAG